MEGDMDGSEKIAAEATMKMDIQPTKQNKMVLGGILLALGIFFGCVAKNRRECNAGRIVENGRPRPMQLGQGSPKG